MKTIRIFRHIDCEGPAHLQTILEQRAIPFELVRIDEGDLVTSDLESVAGLIFMGGSMSVNDDLAWIHQELVLIQKAVRENIPVMGVCLGSQLIAKALGAKVYPGKHNCMELGWSPIQCTEKNAWTKGLPDSFDVFHWHGETFDLPDGATCLFSNDLYANQGFVVGPHLGLQFHVEMDAPSVREWVGQYTDDITRRCTREHDAKAMLDDLENRIKVLQKFAGVLFDHWLKATMVN